MRPSGTRVRGRLGACGLAGWCVVGLLIAGCGSHARTGSPPASIGTGQIQTRGPRVSGFGDAFAGVTRTGELHSIAATWRVPAVRPGSQLGQAATWIGAQELATQPGMRLLDTPFIQLGTREEQDRSGSSTHGEQVDDAFWTDTRRGLNPVHLLSVRAGDTVAARMSLAGQQWTLTIADETTGQHQRVRTGDEGTGHFQLALWLQEDPTDSVADQRFPYPELAPVHVSALRVDNAVPAPGTLQTTWMALPHAYLGPATPAADAFTVAPRTLSAAGAAYLRIADRADAQIDHFFAVSSSWRQGVSQTVIRAAINRYIRALQTNASELLAARWPGRVARLTRRLAAIDRAQVTALRRAVGVGPAAVLAALSSGSSGEEPTRLGPQIRDALGLPLGSY